MSGYAEDAFEKNLPEGVKFNFLAKPFTLKQLVAAVKGDGGRGAGPLAGVRAARGPPLRHREALAG